MKSIFRPATGLPSRPLIILATLSCLILVMCCTSCGKDDPVSPNQAPVISNLAIKQARFATAELKADVHDPDGEVASIVIDWGDAKTEDMEAAPSIVCEHRFKNPASYTVTIKVTDDKGKTTLDTKSIEITAPQERCVGWKGLVDFCFQIAGDFEVVRVWAEFLGEKQYFFNLTPDHPTDYITLMDVGVYKTRAKITKVGDSVAIAVQQKTIVTSWDTVWSDTINF